MFTFKKFTAALKAKFSTNKTPTSSHRFGLFLSDGTPDGNATPADVMQLLGAFAYKGILGSSTNEDFNDYKDQTCFYYISSISNIINKPEDFTQGGGWLEILKANTNTEHVLQRVTKEYDGSMWVRRLNGTSWSTWIRK